MAFYPTKGYNAMIISPLFFFYSVYIFLSSMNIVALDDLHGEFSMDLFKNIVQRLL